MVHAVFSTCGISAPFPAAAVTHDADDADDADDDADESR